MCKTRLPFLQCTMKFPTGKSRFPIGKYKTRLPDGQCKTRLPNGSCKTRLRIGQCKTKLQVGSCKTRLPYVSHFRSICFFVLHVTRITAAQCCVGWRRPCIKLLFFFISLQGGCKWKHDCKAAALDVTGGSPNLFWLALLYASSGCISHAGNYAFWLEMRKFEMWKAHCGGMEQEWMKKQECHQSLYVYQASSTFVVPSWCHINRYYTGIVWNQGQVTHIQEGACCGALCHERSASATTTATKKPDREHQLVLFLNTWLSFSACLRMEGN